MHRYEGFCLANHEKAKSHRYQQPLRSNPDLLQEWNISRMAFFLILVKEELISVHEFIESLGTHATLIFVPLRSTLNADVSRLNGSSLDVSFRADVDGNKTLHVLL